MRARVRASACSRVCVRVELIYAGSECGCAHIGGDKNGQRSRANAYLRWHHVVSSPTRPGSTPTQEFLGKFSRRVPLPLRHHSPFPIQRRPTPFSPWVLLISRRDHALTGEPTTIHKPPKPHCLPTPWVLLI